jgi:hypothetical protein
MPRKSAEQRAIDILTNEGFSAKMIHVVKTVAASTEHRTIHRWLKWFQKLDMDAQMDVELNIIELTYRFVHRKRGK